ncbi:MAG TPA: M23 family metallopeptidase [Longimicrobiales bacterium]|nr:M23 family metallopeptidase [Longimicrobiales bacterium]
MSGVGRIWSRALVVTSAAIAAAACSAEPPEAGRLDRLHVPPAETVRIHSLRSGQTFGGLLTGVISANEQASLLMAFREHASPRRMRQGTEITLRFLREEDELRGVDVALSPDETLRLSREPLGWKSNLIETPVYIDTLFTSGEIESVLWSAVVRNPALAAMTLEDRNRLIDHLDRVFQWQVDFSRQIQVGDTYRFAFEREVRPDGSMRAGKLLSAELVNSGTPFHAIWFDPNDDGNGSYFDLDGESVRRAFLLKPLAYRRISSRFTNSRFHPILKTWRSHRGVDYAADAGTEIMATADGVVIHRGFDSSYGNSIQIRHPNGFVTRYAHMRGFRSGIVVGSRVKQGEVIGYVGMTGLATGNHLHYEMVRSGRHMDPLSVDLPAGDPVPSQDRIRWLEERSVRVALLESIPEAGPVREFVAQARTQGDEVGSAPAAPSGGQQ